MPVPPSLPGSLVARPPDVSVSRAAAVALTLVLLTASPGSAQDGFGAAVTLTDGGEAVVLKPGAAEGSAGVFRRTEGGGWTRVAWLPRLASGMPGEGLTHSVVEAGGFLLLGGGDPDGLVAGHLYARTAGEVASWEPVARVPMDPSRDLPVERADRSLDMPTLMRLMQPPERGLALGPSGRVLAVAGGALEPGTVRILRRSPDDVWEEAALLQGPEGEPSFGAAMAFDAVGGRVVVGAPEEGVGGAAYVFGDDGAGEWSELGRVATDSTEADARLGAAVAMWGAATADGAEAAFLGAPGAERVLRIGPGTDGTWVRLGELDSPFRGDPDRAPGTTAFGGRMTLHPAHGVVVAAPTVDERRGAVLVYEPESWTLREVIQPDELRPGDVFGASVGVGEAGIIVGAPGAAGGEGRAWVRTDGAEAGAWLEAGTELTTVTGEEPVRCAEGEAAGFDCEGVDLVSFVSLSDLGAAPGERVSDLWGWTDPETGRDYVLAGRTAGLAFVDVTVPGQPRMVALMPANPSGARDIKVYADHAFMTGDGAGDHGLLVFDLTRLRNLSAVSGDPGGEVPRLEPDAVYDAVASVHNLVIDTESGFAYTVGTNTGGQSCGGGLHMIDIRTPTEPTFAGCYTDTEGLIWSGRTHDAQCTVYRGPDEDYQGRQICFAANETALRIVDVTDKASPVPIAAVSHPGTAYIHQGWLTEDHRYLYVNDELDEIVGTTERTRTLIWDVAELDDPILVAEHLGPDQATDHNLYIEGDRAYLANYQAGFRVLDISDPENPVEVGWFDTTPYGPNPPGFGGGAWTAYPFFESGVVAVSSMNEGLFLLRPRPAVLP